VSKFKIQPILIDAAIVAFIGGILSTYILGPIISALGGIGMGIMTIVIAILALYLLREAKLTNFVEILVIVAVAMGIGTLVTTFVPALASMVLVVPTTLSFAVLPQFLLYVALADLIGDKLGL
jgi:hypothetical protein